MQEALIEEIKLSRPVVEKLVEKSRCRRLGMKSSVARVTQRADNASETRRRKRKAWRKHRQ